MIPSANNSDISASFWLGPYSSGLTGSMSPYANETNTILIAGGAAATSKFEGYNSVFGTFPPTKKYLAQAIEALSKAGAKTAASVWEEASFTKGVCAALPELAEQHGLIVQTQTEVQASSPDLDPIARNMSRPEEDPDVVVTCVYDKGCAEWIAAMRRAKWSPKAQVFTVCIGMDSFASSVGTDAQYMTGISPWDPSLLMTDDVVGWSAREFAELFLSNTARSPTYHSASGAASIGVLVQAIERADSFDSDTIRSILSTEEFTTLYGRVSFDENGQSKAPSLFLQFDNNTVNTVYPIEIRSGELIYPMPSWDKRDCTLLSTCETGSVSTSTGKCQADGSCDCDNDNAISSGKGSDASCVVVPEEDKTYINSSLAIFGYVLFSIQCLLSIICGLWTAYYRKRKVVKASQPLFLGLVCLGVFVMNCSILPIGVQGNYRDDPSIAKVDAACMALPWLFSIGFAIIFSALFAKIWRIRLVWKAASNFRNKKVDVKDVIVIMAAVIMIQLTILLCWQLINPMQWEREVIQTDTNGFPIRSIGYCTSSASILPYLIPLVVVDGLMLLYALYLCFVTRKVSSEFQEGQWISACVLSIVQILVLSIPILIIVENNNDAFYFVRTAVIFLMGFSVTGLIFFPKMYRLHFQAQERRGFSFAARKSTFERRSQQRPSVSSSYNKPVASSYEIKDKSSAAERRYSAASSVEIPSNIDDHILEEGVNDATIDKVDALSTDSFHSAIEKECR